MSVDKMVDTTKKVLEKQKELIQLVVELKEEVKAVERENKDLRHEINRLKHQAQPEPQSPQTKPQQTTSDPFKGSKPPVVPVVEKQPQKPEQKPINKADKAPIKRERSATEKTIIEFFLGKNVIVKIAAILMVLAIITFGQIAYVDFLEDVGRFILILGIGIFFLALAFFFEQKNAITYSNIFYLLGLVILLVDMVLGRYEYELYMNPVGMIYLIILTVVPLLYFYKKEFDFLHIAIIPYYAFIIYLPIILYGSVTITVTGFLLITGLLLLGGYAIYHTAVHLISDKHVFIVFDYIVLTVLAVFVNIEVSSIVTSSSVSLAHFNVLMYQMVLIALFYALNVKTLSNRVEGIQYVLLSGTTVAFILLGITLNGTFNELTNTANDSLGLLFATLLFVPVYVYLYRHRNDQTTIVTNLYLVVLAVVGLIFTFLVKGRDELSLYRLELYLKNIILIVETAILFTVMLFTKDKAQRFVSFVFIGVITIVSMIHFGQLWYLSFSEWTMFVPTIIASLSFFGLHYFFGEQKTRTKDIVTTFLIVSFIPLFLVIGSDALNGDEPVIIASVVLYLGLARQLFRLDLFKSTHQNELIVGTNSVIVLLVFLANLYYFDHNFNMLYDVFQVLFVGLINIYLIQAIRELYNYIKDHYKVKPETLFIVLYLLGTAIQAVFITTNINFSFDKVILSSYYMISASIAILIGFQQNWFNVRRIGLFAIYFSLAKFFIYDFLRNDFDLYVRFLSFFILAIVLFGISALYSYLERTYGTKQE